MSTKTILFLLITLLLLVSVSYAIGHLKKLRLPSLIGDNMVLQQNSEINVWGVAEPFDGITVIASWGTKAKAIADRSGKWSTKLKTPKAGGPYNIEIKTTSETISLNDVLIGEVWLCSGQSNMEMPLKGWPPNDTIQNSKAEIISAKNNLLRFFTIPRGLSLERRDQPSGSWEICTPSEASGFSATAYFFGKKLTEELQIPVGLIHSSWGGTRIEAWTPAEGLAELSNYSNILKQLEVSKPEIAKLDKWLRQWEMVDLTKKPIASRWTENDFEDDIISAIRFDDSKWKEMNLPVLWEQAGLRNFDGVVWFRKSIELPKNFTNKQLMLELGTIDDMDRTYVNGELVGAGESEGLWNVKRKYEVISELNTTGKLVISVRVTDFGYGGGIWGKPEDMRISVLGTNESISLAGKWKYLPVAEYKEMKFIKFGSKGEPFYSRPQPDYEFNQTTPASLFNAMIAPLTKLTIKGVIWYQGESNSENANAYKELFPLMIKSWRKEFNVGDFPFYFAQIAPYNYGENINSAELRNAQFKTLSVANTGMAVTLDIGNANNIHPANKKAVGDRLAFCALANDYGRNIEYSGPIFKSKSVQGEKLILEFTHCNGLKTVPDQAKFIFEIAGEDGKYFNANYKIIDDKVELTSAKVLKPCFVRYAWGNTPEAVLINNSWLPAGTFED